MDGSPADAVLKMSQLRNITLNDETLMREVVAALLSDASHKISALEQAIEAGARKECVQIAHSAAGACGNVGALALAALFRSVERHASLGDLAGSRPLIGSLREEWGKLRSAAAKLW